jgi:hypothetical protein
MTIPMDMRSRRLQETRSGNPKNFPVPDLTHIGRLYGLIHTAHPLHTVKDFVILSGSLKAGRWACEAVTGCQIHTPNFEMYNGNPSCSAAGSQSYLWNSAVQTLSCDSIFDYYNNNSKWGSQKPWWRFTFILDRTTGTEITPFAPFNPSGFDGDNQGFHQPPVVGADNVLYKRIGINAGGNGGCTGWISGWKFGTKYVSNVASENSACDEPSAYTSGGKYIYYGEGSFNHEGFGTINTTLAPNDLKWSSEVAKTSGKYSSLTLTGKFGGTSGAYSIYGWIQQLQSDPL